MLTKKLLRLAVHMYKGAQAAKVYVLYTAYAVCKDLEMSG